jgi:hypothetical protein
MPQDASLPWQHSFSLSRPSWKRSEVLGLIHPVDEVIAVLRRIRLVENDRGVGPAATEAYIAALDLVTSLHTLMGLLPPPRDVLPPLVLAPAEACSGCEGHGVVVGLEGRGVESACPTCAHGGQPVEEASQDPVVPHQVPARP